MTLKTILALVVTTSLAAPAFADDALVVEKQAEPKNSINVSPLGVVAGNYALTYERLFAGSHGLIVEGNGGFGGDDTSSYSQFGGGIGYRWHWRGRQNSGFLGIMVASSFGTGETTTEDSSGARMTHELTVRSTTITGNIGKRWMFGPVNATIRLGLGYGDYSAKVKSDAPGAQEAEDALNSLLSFIPIGFDGEVSVGYTF
jgi:hypothetical protein